MVERIQAEPSFHDLFRACTHRQRIGNRDITYTLMQSEDSGDPTVYFFPGLGLSYTTYSRFLESIYKKGKSFFAVENLGAGQFSVRGEPGGEEKFQNALKELAKWKNEGCVFSDAQVERAISVIGVIEKLSLRLPMDVVAHSAGAIDAVLTATLRPQLFRKILLYAPAAMIKENDPNRLKLAAANFAVLFDAKLRALGLAPGGKHDSSFIPGAEVDYESFMWTQSMRGDFGGAAKIGEVATTYVAPMVSALIEQGVQVSAGIGGKDHLYPRGLLEPALKENNIPYFLLAGAGHYALGTRARAGDRIVHAL